ncbi:MAG: hypothetical protein RLZZ214_4187, partial [Verrucomicrobiota bacterium]
MMLSISSPGLQSVLQLTKSGLKSWTNLVPSGI